VHPDRRGPSDSGYALGSTGSSALGLRDGPQSRLRPPDRRGE
jgi:hypothetical protein